MDIQAIYQIYQSHPVVTTDTRNCKPGAIFFALKGENFDGNNFIEAALQKGCEYAICDNPTISRNERIILVEDSLKTLQELANYHRKQLNVPIIAITGTNGKTTTKELIAAVLSEKYNVLFTQGNLNNHIGVPLTLLQLRPEHDYAVIEMGANHPGEIRLLAEIAEPNYGIITNVGKAHLEGFGSFEGVIRTKGELYDFLRKRVGLAFINHENTYLEAIAFDLKKIYYGTTSESFIWGNAETSGQFLVFDWHQDNYTYHVNTQLVGNYNLENVLAAISIAFYFEVDSPSINRAIEAYSPQNNRSQFKDVGKNKLIIDAYNANPTSMLAALDNFSKMNVHPKMVLLGDMKELGQYSKEEHQKIVDYIESSSFDEVILCGSEFFSLKPVKGKCFESTDTLLQYLQVVPIVGYNILIKGSHGVHLERLIPLLSGE